MDFARFTIEPELAERLATQTKHLRSQTITVPRHPTILTGTDWAGPTPDELHLIASDGTKQECVVLAKDRAERLIRCVDLLIAMIELGPVGDVLALAAQAKRDLQPGDTLLP